MTRSRARIGSGSPARSGSSAVVWTAVVLAMALPGAAPAVDLTYHVPTSAPDGRAVCAVKGSLKKGAPTQLDVHVSPTSGEALLDFDIVPKGHASGAGTGGEVGAGTQAGCDIFPDTPSTFTGSWSGDAANFLGILDLHAHPGADCASPGTAEGTLTLSAGSTAAKLRPLTCDASASHANLGLRVLGDMSGTKGGIMSQEVQVMNHGPADATNAMFTARFSRNLFVSDVSTTKGLCRLDSQKNTASCTIGSVPSLGWASVTMFMIPLKQGTATTSYGVGAENKGSVLPSRTVVKSDVAQGNSAILNVTVKCKGAAGTVTINPNGNGGVTTCTCPDPNDATRTTVGCVETYAQMTTVALTPAATTGKFNRWTGACAGNAGACTVTIDPAAQNPDKSATAVFK